MADPGALEAPLKHSAQTQDLLLGQHLRASKGDGTTETYAEATDRVVASDPELYFQHAEQVLRGEHPVAKRQTAAVLFGQAVDRIIAAVAKSGNRRLTRVEAANALMRTTTGRRLYELHARQLGSTDQSWM
jgi:hypothetical protein